MRRRTKIILGILAGIPMLAVIAAFVVVPRIELASLVASRATAELGRTVTIRSLRVSPGLNIRAELRGARLDNIEGGSRPAMVEVASLSAEVELLPLLRGAVVLPRVAADGFSLLLERTADRRANWHFGPPRTPGPAAGATPSPPPTAVVAAASQPAPPADRSGLPLVLDLRLTSSEVVFRTTGGNNLRTRLEIATLATTGADAPVMLRATGSYNEVPVTLEAPLGSFAMLRNTSIPFPIELRAASSETTLDFQGTATDPLNLDGMVGRLTLHVPTPDALLTLAGAGADGAPQVPIGIGGTFTRNGDVWTLANAEGSLDGAAFSAPVLRLTEGSAGRPDAIAADMAFTRLDVNRLLGAPPVAGQTEHGDADLPLVVPAMPDPLVQVTLAAEELVYARLIGTDARLKAAIAPGRLEVETLALFAYGSRISASGAITAEAGVARIAAEVHLVAGDVDTLRRAFGIHALPLSGRIEGHVVVTTEGTRLNDATRRGHVSAVLAMRNGHIAREVIEMASTDIRALLRSAEGTTPVSCLLALVDIREGRGRAAPLRIRAGTGTVSGLGSFDLNRKTLDLVIGSQRETTNFFALDVPIRVSGSFSDPNIAPAELSRQGRAQLAAADNVATLPPALRDFARSNPCYFRGRSRD